MRRRAINRCRTSIVAEIDACSTRASFGCERTNHSRPSTRPVLDSTWKSERLHHRPREIQLMATARVGEEAPLLKNAISIRSTGTKSVELDRPVMRCKSPRVKPTGSSTRVDTRCFPSADSDANQRVDAGATSTDPHSPPGRIVTAPHQSKPRPLHAGLTLLLRERPLSSRYSHSYCQPVEGGRQSVASYERSPLAEDPR